jgi:beta-phosphoglucomutase
MDNQTNIRAVIFDMDGVLVDSEKLINTAAITMFQERGLIVQPDDFLPFVGAGEDRYIGGVAERYSFPLDGPTAKQRTYEIYLELAPSQLAVFPGTLDLLHACRQAGLLIAVASSADEIKVRANLQAIGLPLDFWGAIVVGEDALRKKPAPDGFLFAAEKLGVMPADCVVVEDAVNGIRAAKAARMRCVAVATSFSPDHLHEADVVRNSIAEVSISDLAPQFEKS